MLRRTLMMLAVATGFAALSAGTAMASVGSAPMAVPAATPAPAPAPAAAPAAPSNAEVAAAHSAATASLGTVGRFLAAGGQKPQGTAEQQEAAAVALAPRLDSATVPVYYLSAAFVADTSSNTAAPVANLAFLATDAVGTSGAHASVWAAKVGSAWKVVNIAQGSDETAYAAQTRPGGTVFAEPQIGAWYQLIGGRVLPLDATAQQSVGAKGMSLAEYHKLVRSRYADKLPGSAYDRAGIAGGFQPRNPALGKGSGSDDAAMLGTAGLVLAAAGAGFVVHRRRHGAAAA